ncbi:hypothetical protein NAEGRDRAFT_63852 [Naegleria gruberi]|uniref:F-box domain-containing protein n=1 Tax=Naegleria gruberi TaxID=5762 RepID=D2V4N4_NAEGR|nr:uncharacterized protein NAEGRDRAFT_63852 [Naegleria gruberi]EFC47962.1 hypothetical protein NAEGRDRAFT_63852 [Naegleria gruberi]|eukprot:XP_002680706.1 hypothetical protein NAEGRDRAFT_63852 [Naegleria gruberi strain NEG-M]
MKRKLEKKQVLVGKKIKMKSIELFPDDICYEILKYLNFQQVLLNACKISKQFYRISTTRYEFTIKSEETADDWFKYKSIWTKFVKYCEKHHCPYLKNVRTLIIIDVLLVLDDDEWEIVCAMKELRELRLEIFIKTLENKQIQMLAKHLTKLEKIILGGNVSDENVQQFQLFPNLTSLKIPQGHITNLKNIAKLEKLTELDIGECCDIVLDDGLSPLALMKNLTSLSLSKIVFAPEEYKPITQLPRLVSLDVSSSDNTVESIKILTSSLKQLTIFNISNNFLIGDEAARLIGESLKQLTFLNISNTNLQPQGVKYICELTELRHLEMGENQIFDQEVVFICKSKFSSKLTNLDLKNTRISKECLKSLSTLDNLQYLNLMFTEIDKSNITFPFKKLRFLTLKENNLDGDELEELTNFNQQ